MKRSETKTLEEESDAFCAAEEARAAVEGRPPSLPDRPTDGIIWRFVTRAYRDLPSDPNYEPVGQTFEELARKAGIGPQERPGP